MRKDAEAAVADAEAREHELDEMLEQESKEFRASLVRALNGQSEDYRTLIELVDLRFTATNRILYRYRYEVQRMLLTVGELAVLVPAVRTVASLQRYILIMAGAVPALAFVLRLFGVI